MLVTDLLTMHHRYMMASKSDKRKGGERAGGREGAYATVANVAEPSTATEQEGQLYLPQGDADGFMLLKGETTEAREAGGSSYGGFVRLRPELWPRSEVRALVSQLWEAWKRVPSSKKAING